MIDVNTVGRQAREMARLYEPEWLAQMYLDVLDELVKHIPNGHTFPVMGNTMKWVHNPPSENKNGGTIIDPDKIVELDNMGSPK